MQMNLTDLAARHSTDKLEHGYIPFYEQHLPKDPNRILEIGVKEGASIKMWLEYFPESEVHGLDLFIENDPIELLKWAEENGYSHRLFLHKGNQCDWEMLEQLRKHDFDIVIDDGSHNSRDQMMTFFGLFNGKHYFIEDLQCNDEDFYSQGLPMQMRAAKLFNSEYAWYDCQSPIVLIMPIE
jgi:hypothetical protein